MPKKKDRRPQKPKERISFTYDSDKYNSEITALLISASIDLDKKRKPNFGVV